MRLRCCGGPGSEGRRGAQCDRNEDVKHERDRQRDWATRLWVAAGAALAAAVGALLAGSWIGGILAAVLFGVAAALTYAAIVAFGLAERWDARLADGRQRFRELRGRFDDAVAEAGRHCCPGQETYDASSAMPEGLDGFRRCGYLVTVRWIILLALGATAMAGCGAASTRGSAGTPADSRHAARVFCWMGVAQGRVDDAVVRGACLAAGDTMCALNPSPAACAGVLAQPSQLNDQSRSGTVSADFDVVLSSEPARGEAEVAVNPYVRPPASPYVVGPSSAADSVPANPFGLSR